MASKKTKFFLFLDNLLDIPIKVVGSIVCFCEEHPFLVGFGLGTTFGVASIYLIMR